MNNNLINEFERIKQNIRYVIKKRVAKVCFSASTARVFPKGAATKIEESLLRIDIDHMLHIQNAKDFKT
jgi:hypothetical protein